MKKLEKTAQELDRVLNLGGRVCEVKLDGNKIRVEYFDAGALKDKTRELGRREAEKMIDDVYRVYGIPRRR